MYKSWVVLRTILDAEGWHNPHHHRWRRHRRIRHLCHVVNSRLSRAYLAL